MPQHLPRERRRGHTIKDDCGTCSWRDQCKHGFRAAGADSRRSAICRSPRAAVARTKLVGDFVGDTCAMTTRSTSGSAVLPCPRDKRDLPNLNFEQTAFRRLSTRLSAAGARRSAAAARANAPKSGATRKVRLSFQGGGDRGQWRGQVQPPFTLHSESVHFGVEVDDRCRVRDALGVHRGKEHQGADLGYRRAGALPCHYERILPRGRRRAHRV